MPSPKCGRWVSVAAIVFSAVLIPRAAEAQTRAYSDGPWNYVLGQNCPGNLQAWNLTKQKVGYYRSTTDSSFPLSGDVYYIHFVVENIHPCQSSYALTEVYLPAATQFAISSTNRVYCFYRNPQGVVSEITPAGGCPQSPVSGAYGSRFNPSGGWPLAPGAVIEVQIPVVSTQAVDDYLYAYVKPDTTSNWGVAYQVVSVAAAAPPPDTTPPDTVITQGPTGLAIGSSPSFGYGGSDNTTPASSLTYATRVVPGEAAFSSFGNATFRKVSNLANGHYTLHVKARDAAGNEDPTPATRSFTVNAGMVIGPGGSGGAGWLQTRLGGEESAFALQQWTQVPWASYNSANGEVHPAVGDVDGDGLDEIVIGLGQGSGGWIVILDDAQHNFAVLKWIQIGYDSYNSANGTVYPAVGNIDGDAAAEIVLGLGSGGEGWWVAYDDANANFQSLGWRRISWASYNSSNGATHPAIANVSGDARGEIIMGLGLGGAGWMEAFDAVSTVAYRWIQVPWPTYNSANGETWPAGGNLVTDDAEHELVVGLGSGSTGYVATLDGASGNFGVLRWFQVNWGQYRTNNGTVHPAVGNLDGDAEAEVVLGLGAFIAGEGGWFEMRDDLVRNHASLGWRNMDWATYRQTGGGVFPAIIR